MDNNKAVAVKREWVEVALNIIRFFFQHSTFEYDGIVFCKTFSEVIAEYFRR